MKVTEQIKLLVQAKALELGVKLADGWKDALAEKLPADENATDWARSIGASESVGELKMSIEYRQDVVDDKVMGERRQILERAAREITSLEGISKILKK